MLRSMATRQTQVSTLKAAAGQPSAGEARAGLMQPSSPPHSPAWGPRPARPCRFYFLPSKNGAEGGRKTHLKNSPETWSNSRRVSAPENSLPGHPGGRPWPPAPQIKGPPPTLPTVAAQKELSLVQAECDASRLT